MIGAGLGARGRPASDALADGRQPLSDHDNEHCASEGLQLETAYRSSHGMPAIAARAHPAASALRLERGLLPAAFLGTEASAALQAGPTSSRGGLGATA